MKLNLFHNMKLFKKFLLTYCLVIIVPIFIIATYSYSKLSSIITKNITTSTKEAFNQSLDFIDYKIYKIFDISNTIVIDNTITSVLKKNPDEYELSAQISDFRVLQNYLSSFQNTVDVKKAKLYINDNYIYSSEDVNFHAISQLADSPANDTLINDNSRYLWGLPSYLNEDDSNNELFLLKSIIDPDDFSKNLGYLRIDFNKSILEDIINKISPLDGSLSFIINSNEDIIASTGNAEEFLSQSSLTLESIEKLSTSNNDFNEIDNGIYYLQCHAINKTDWYMVNILSKNSITSAITKQKSYLFLIVLLSSTVSIILAGCFIHVINNRLLKVIDGMRAVPNGKLDNYIENYSSDEIGELIDNYNYMISKMSILIENQYKLGKEVKNAELKALQAQINPHFLYNTLDMINWMSYKNMNKEISAAVKALAKFYKLSLNKGKDIVTIEDELQHSKFYVQLQNMRYNNRIHLDINISEELIHYYIPKITFQPIIENSILHGILGRGMEDGTIMISGYKENNKLTIQISDDGIGIPAEVIPLILTDNNLKTKGSGYGLKNINERIKILYGEDYGLSFTSNLGAGTTVEIVLPIINE